ncbi:protocatechuate 3,4-dioxygenase subunit alpha [Geodermatophilus sp. DF01-2]|uniref:protocatechuate 3,4-dioxygenase subunit alpha n=1 Tax=Geodermatophilus sp. DF01-2 TaxID=2559610 RepID=UPI001073EC06|nr:protocatechuate 3,4-dioxygenase subunit alpha [Geodermatophilus sp. DF01_2]TFV53081.1 protocatechuate 3,4-dioxygenase subunit alpha [Geodermatophilus sp. DF01_2]
MTQLQTTPSATVGPYWAIGLTWEDGPHVVAPDAPGAVWIRGRIYDGAGKALGVGLVETWQADPDGRFDHPDDPRGSSAWPGFRGFGRSSMANGGEFAICTLKPGRVPDGEGGLQAPHLDVSIFSQGLLDRVVTRIYFADEAEANAEDVVLHGMPEDRRATLVATPAQDGYRFDIHLQGDRETVFFAV